jgi:hypothetical protein
MPNDIRFKLTPDTRKAWRIAAMIYAANVLSDDGLHHAAQHLRIKSASLKFGVPGANEDFFEFEEP